MGLKQSSLTVADMSSDRKEDLHPIVPSINGVSSPRKRSGSHFKTEVSTSISIGSSSQAIPVLDPGRIGGLRSSPAGSSSSSKSRTSTPATLPSTSEFNFELTEGQCRRSLMADCEYECSEIFDFLYVGGAEIAKSWDILERYGIRRIVNCSASVVDNHFEDRVNMRYLSLSMVDGRQDDISWFMCDVAQFVLKALNDGEKVLIHCERGVSRSCSFAIAYHMWSTGSNWKESFEHVKSCRVVCAPNTAFTCNLIEISDMLHGSSLNRPVMFRCAAHLPHDCETPVLKICRNSHTRKLVVPRTSILDPDGVFLIRVPEVEGAELKYLYIWQGQNAPDEVARIAGVIALNMISVLTSAKKVIIMKSGKEVPEFYDYVVRDGSFSQEVNAEECYDDFYDIQPESAWSIDQSIDTSNVHTYDGEKYFLLSERRCSDSQQQDGERAIVASVANSKTDVVPPTSCPPPSSTYQQQVLRNGASSFAIAQQTASRPLSFPSPSAIDRLKGRSKPPLLSMNAPDNQVDGIATTYAPRVPDPPSPASPSVRHSLPGRALGTVVIQTPSKTILTMRGDQLLANVAAPSSPVARNNLPSEYLVNPTSAPNHSAHLVVPQFRGKASAILNPSFSVTEGMRPSLMLPQQTWASSSPRSIEIFERMTFGDNSSSSPALMTRKYRSDSSASNLMLRSPSASPISLPLLNIPPADGPPSPLAFRLPGELSLVRGPTPTPTPRTPMSSMRKEFNQSSIMIEVPIDLQNLPPQKPKPRLYQFAISPIGETNYRWEAMGIYEEEDLDEKNVLLLACPEGPHFLWVGAAFNFRDVNGCEEDISLTAEGVTESFLAGWASKVKRGDVKAIYTVETSLLHSGALEIARDGYEPDAFWIAFNEASLELEAALRRQPLIPMTVTIVLATSCERERRGQDLPVGYICYGLSLHKTECRWFSCWKSRYR